MMRFAIHGAIILTALVLNASAHENHDHATGVVKERMVGMEGMATRMKAISERIAARRNLNDVKTDAEVIAELASHIPHLFPKGSTQHPTQAKGTIWQNWTDFERRARAVETESKKLAAMKLDNPIALETQRRAIIQACGGCHERYRTKR